MQHKPNNNRWANRSGIGVVVLASIAAVLASTTTAYAQSYPWDVFEDLASGSVCDVINGGEVNGQTSEFVVYTDTGELILVTGNDTILGDSFVDANNDVFFDGQYFGFVDFAEDADGFSTLWWLDDLRQVVAFDTFTLSPVTTTQTPDEFEAVPCDACDFWDDQTVCDVVDPGPAGGGPSISFSFCGQGMLAGTLLSLMGLFALGRCQPRVR